MSYKIFVAGTDTGVGKTYVSTIILSGLQQGGYSTLGIKPLATGGVSYQNPLYNEDAVYLQQNSSVQLNYTAMNPLIFEPPIAPHIAAQQIQVALSVELLTKACGKALNTPVDICLVEGVGGWFTPLNDRETMADFVKRIDCKVLLVVGIRLGCLNHALLTQSALQQSGIESLGWIANCIDPNMLFWEENIKTLQGYLKMPFLGFLPWQNRVC